MKPDLWSEVERLVHEAMQLPPGQRRRFVVNLRDTEIREEVLSLLRAGEQDRQSIGALIAGSAPADVDRAPLAGRRFSHFQVIREIGRGGMGEVYLRSIQTSNATWRSSCCRRLCKRMRNGCAGFTARRARRPR